MEYLSLLEKFQRFRIAARLPRVLGLHPQSSTCPLLNRFARLHRCPQIRALFSSAAHSVWSVLLTTEGRPGPFSGIAVPSGTQIYWASLATGANRSCASAQGHPNRMASFISLPI